MSEDRSLASLNEAQREAVASDPDRSILVLAGAGSGKTRVLTHRFVWLADTQAVDPRSILAVTFTNKAATEMRERIRGLRTALARELWIGTFHALCRRMLVRFHDAAGLPASFQILDRDDQKILMREVLEDLGARRAASDIQNAITWISRQKSEGLRARHLEPGNELEERWAKIMARYEQHCEKSGRVDFDELLLRCVELLREHPEAQNHYRRRFRHLLVDEFQDVNQLQTAWLKLLAGDDIPLFVVGDDDQAIYSWRGASADYMLRFEQIYPRAQRRILDRNYRSTAPVLEVANRLIEHNRARHAKRLWTQNKDGKPVLVFGARAQAEEVSHVLDGIQKWQKAGGNLRDCAVLYRTNRQSQPFETALNLRNIPYRVYGGVRFFQRREVKEALAYLQLCRNPEDDVAWHRVCNRPPRGIGVKTIEEVRARAAGGRMSAAAAARKLIQDQPGTRAAQALAEFGRCLDALRQGEPGLVELLRNVLETTGLMPMYRESDEELQEERGGNLEQLVNVAAAFEAAFDPHEAGLSNVIDAFLDSTALEAGERGEGNSGDAVQLMTLHMAKGLEFPRVFISGLEERTLPILRDDADIEEERRLCYVGITRAREELTLTYSYQRWVYGKSVNAEPSRFLRELQGLPAASIEWTVPQEGLPIPARARAEKDSYALANLDVPHPGEPVVHPKFGPGVIVEYEGRPPQLRVRVDFDDAGAKWLMYDYAKLGLR